MKEIVTNFGRIALAVVLYSTLIWLCINPVLGYFEIKPVTWVQSISFVGLIITSILLIKEL